MIHPYALSAEELNRLESRNLLHRPVALPVIVVEEGKAVPVSRDKTEEKLRGIAARIEVLLKTKKVSSLSQAAKMMSVPKGQLYRAWKSYGPDDWTQPH